MNNIIAYILLPILLNVKPVLKDKLITISYKYENFDGNKHGLNKDVFDKAVKGFTKINSKNLIRNKRYLTICDMSISSKKKRLYILDLKTNKIVYCVRVAHGQGSGEEYANKFSNEEDSHQTSLGFYITGATYTGENGLSLKLNGIEYGINDNAETRSIVMHGSEYVSDEYFKNNNKIGRSWGCPAIAKTHTEKVINLIKNGSCLFIYHPTNKYIKYSKYIK